MIGDTEVTICNTALLKLGDQPITALDATSVRSRACTLLYPIARRAVLRDHPWNFSMVRADLALFAEVPAWGFTKYFQLPTDFLRLVDTDLRRSGIEWSIERAPGEATTVLATDAATVSILYVADITDTARMDSQFVDALASKLAYELALHITSLSERAGAMAQDYGAKLKMAKSSDGMENFPSVLENFDLIDVRGSSSTYSTARDPLVS